jgi:2-haloacid dehalogenase
MTRPTIVVFDLGGILIDWNPRHHFREVFAGDDDAMERIRAEICSPAWNERQDGGRSIAEGEAEPIALGLPLRAH